MPTSAGVICYWKLRGFIPDRSFRCSVKAKICVMLIYLKTEILTYSLKLLFLSFLLFLFDAVFNRLL